jgi:acyl-CoA synthetase (NDP forming)
MIASAGPAEYEGTVRHLLSDPNVDSLIVIYTPAGMADAEEVAIAIGRGAGATSSVGSDKPVIACFISGRERPRLLETRPAERADGRPIPSFRFPEPAARALARAARYAEWRLRPAGRVPDLPDVNPTAARLVVAEALKAHGEGWLRPDDVTRLLAAAGIATPPSRVVATAEEAVAAATAIGFPVAVKIVSSLLTHKSDAGGVVLGLDTQVAVRAACERVRAAVPHDAPVEGFQVQQMVDGGEETIVGVVDDPNFGPLVAFGLGGTAVEVLDDVALRITPLTDSDAHEMAREIRGLPLLTGYRGRAPADLAAVEDLLLRVSWLVETAPQISEMDLNPVKVFGAGRGLMPVDARVYVRGGADSTTGAGDGTRNGGASDDERQNRRSGS